MTPDIQTRHLSYTERLEAREVSSIRLAVIHCTELPDFDSARDWGEKIVHSQSRTGNSGHFYIGRDGSIEAWVPLNRIAHHVRGYNGESVGVELVNRGRYPHWFSAEHQQMGEPYPLPQIQALMALLNSLAVKLPGLEQLAGHEDLDTGLVEADDEPGLMIRRKLDPGPLFPWQEILAGTTLKRFISG